MASSLKKITSNEPPVVVDLSSNAVAASSVGAERSVRKVLALLSLVGVQVLTIVASKISVSGQGEKAFSSSSLFIVAELVKFFMAWGTHASTVWNGSLAGSLRKSIAELVAEWPGLALPYGVLALAYAFNNNLGLVVYHEADIASIAMIRCGSIVVSAIFMMALLGRRFSDVAWAAMLAQSAGVFIAQVNPCIGGFRLPRSTYFMMLLIMVISCLSAVWNEKLVKGMAASLQLQQMSLYSFGFFFNLVAYWAHPAPGGSWLFDGWGPWTVVLAICSASIGIAVINVLKHGDSVLKAMAGPITAFCVTVIDLFLLGTEMTLIALVATVPIFAGSYIYIIETGKRK